MPRPRVTKGADGGHNQGMLSARTPAFAALALAGLGACVSPSVPNPPPGGSTNPASPASTGSSGFGQGGIIPSTPVPVDPFGDDAAVDGPPGVVTVDDATADVDPSAVDAVTLQMTSFTVPPGVELYKCQDFANPFGGQAVDINRYDLEMNPGSHHMLLFYSQGAVNGPVIDCPSGGLQVGPYTFGAQSQKATEVYPAGIGAAIPAGTGFTLNAHYINTGSTPIEAAVKVTMYVAQPGTVMQHVGVLQFIQIGLSVPPNGQPSTSTASCSISQDMNLLSASSHMHRRATHFVATTGATMLYETDTWSDPVARTFSPPLALAANSSIQWSCTYVNDTASALTFGESAATNVMCNFGATFFPLTDLSNPVIRCLQ